MEGLLTSLARKRASVKVQLAPEEPYPHYELGYTLALVGRHQEALEELRRTEQITRAFFAVETEIYMSEQLVSGSIDTDVLEMLRSLQRLVDSGGAQSEATVSLSQRSSNWLTNALSDTSILARRCFSATQRPRNAL
jgi:hypothetical protein